MPEHDPSLIQVGWVRYDGDEWFDFRYSIAEERSPTLRPIGYVPVFARSADAPEMASFRSDDEKDTKVKAIEVQIGDRIREGIVLNKQPAWQTSHGKPIGVSVEFTVKDDTFPYSPERPHIECPQYPADAELLCRPGLNPR